MVQMLVELSLLDVLLRIEKEIQRTNELLRELIEQGKKE
jgi:hypothetical protein